MSTLRKRVLAVAAALAIAATMLPASATITDDINPLDSTVYVELINPDDRTSKGTVEVTATVNGRQVTSSAPFDLRANSSGTVAVQFKATVESVINTGIIEGPDPIPQ